MEKLAREYLDPNGRASVFDYWHLQIFIGIVWIALLLPTILLSQVIGQWSGLVMAPMAPLLAAFLATLVRRLHDRNRSGWWLLIVWPAPSIMLAWLEAEPQGVLMIVSIIASLAVSVLAMWGWIEIGLLPGTRGENRFGPDPRPATRQGLPA